MEMMGDESFRWRAWRELRALAHSELIPVLGALILGPEREIVIATENVSNDAAFLARMLAPKATLQITDSGGPCDRGSWVWVLRMGDAWTLAVETAPLTSHQLALLRLGMARAAAVLLPTHPCRLVTPKPGSGSSGAPAEVWVYAVRPRPN